MAHEQHAPAGACPAFASGQLERLAGARGVEAARQRRVRGEDRPLGLRPALGGQLGGLARANLGAEQHGVETGLKPGQREAGGPRLAPPPGRQAALGVRAGSVRLGLGMT